MTLQQPAAADEYAVATGLPAPGSRVVISGFSRSGFEEARQLLERNGLVPTAFVAGADAVLVPAASSDELAADARKHGRRVILLDELRSNAQAPRHCSAVELTDDSVRILDVTLPRKPAGRASEDASGRFSHLCLDSLFLRAARAVAIAARARLPCALEGDTAVAKSTSVLWVAHLCRQEAIRLNLNGQSDTGELVGRFVPSSDWAHWDLALFHRESHLLEPESQRIIDEAVKAGRDLNVVERTAIAANERIPVVTWRFWEGVIPQAMRDGTWVVLDEVNLAEPQVLERLNPVLEQPPSLVLSEHKGERFGAGGDVPLADSFRIFATMNPAEYSGRSVLSPAFRDRWTMWTFLEPPGETELRAMLTRLVHGVHPEFLFDGIFYRASDSEPIHRGLAAQPGIDRLLEATAAFHSAVATAAGSGEAASLGKMRRERYVFTRRTLLAAMRLAETLVEGGLEVQRAFQDALMQMYVERVQPGPDRQAVATSLRTMGLIR